MTKFVLDQSKLLGFKILANKSPLGAASLTAQTTGAKIGKAIRQATIAPQTGRDSK